MGAMTEKNTLIRLPDDFKDPLSLKPGDKLTIQRKNNRDIPVNIALYLLTADWKFIGYCVVDSYTTGGGETTINATVVSRFSQQETELISRKFIDAALITKELKNDTKPAWY